MKMKRENDRKMLLITGKRRAWNILITLAGWGSDSRKKSY